MAITLAMTRMPDMVALIGGGASEWAGGSQMMPSGSKPAFVPKPNKNSKASKNMSFWLITFSVQVAQVQRPRIVVKYECAGDHQDDFDDADRQINVCRPDRAFRAAEQDQDRTDHRGRFQENEHDHDIIGAGQPDDHAHQQEIHDKVRAAVVGLDPYRRTSKR